MDLNSELYDGRSLADLFSEIHKNTDSKRQQINTFIAKLVNLIRTPEDAVVVGPIVQAFLETNVKNDDQLVKVAQIAQRLILVGQKDGGGGETLLTEEEKQTLLKNIRLDVQSLEDEIKNEPTVPKKLVDAVDDIFKK